MRSCESRLRLQNVFSKQSGSYILLLLFYLRWLNPSNARWTHVPVWQCDSVPPHGNVLNSNGNVVSGHRVPEVQQGVGAADGLLHRQLLGHSLEEGRVLDVGGGLVPGVESGLGGGELVPVCVASCDLAVDFLTWNRERELIESVNPMWNALKVCVLLYCQAHPNLNFRMSLSKVHWKDILICQNRLRSCISYENQSTAWYN